MIEVAFSETDSLELLDAARRAQAGRASRTVVGGQQHAMRQTVIVLLANAALSEHESPGEATLYVISGRVALSVGQETREAGSGELLVIPQRRHSLRALRHSTVLLTAVPREYTPAIDQGDPT